MMKALCIALLLMLSLQMRITLTLFNAAGEKTLYLTWNDMNEKSVVSDEVPIG
jgi:hypothetical protein